MKGASTLLRISLASSFICLPVVLTGCGPPISDAQLKQRAADEGISEAEAKKRQAAAADRLRSLGGD